jgi:hypothetical protein
MSKHLIVTLLSFTVSRVSNSFLLRRRKVLGPSSVYIRCAGQFTGTRSQAQETRGQHQICEAASHRQTLIVCSLVERACCHLRILLEGGLLSLPRPGIAPRIAFRRRGYQQGGSDVRAVRSRKLKRSASEFVYEAVRTSGSSPRSLAFLSSLIFIYCSLFTFGIHCDKYPQR